MSVAHQFGGDWTEQKLKVLAKYLKAYLTILNKHPYYQTLYVDAFAGTGQRATKAPISFEQNSLFGDDTQTHKTVRTSSVQTVLDLNHGFNEYLFIERRPSYCRALHAFISSTYAARLPQIQIVCGDANSQLLQLSQHRNWQKRRGVIFLDPYGMDVNWDTVAAIAATKALELWILVPAGMGYGRVLTKDHLPNESWATRLTECLGTADWVGEFYEATNQSSLFGENAKESQRIVSVDDIASYYVKRLRTVFPYVTEKPVILTNNKLSPMYALCFASHNATGFKIAADILNKEMS